MRVCQSRATLTCEDWLGQQTQEGRMKYISRIVLLPVVSILAITWPARAQTRVQSGGNWCVSCATVDYPLSGTVNVTGGDLLVVMSLSCNSGTAGCTSTTPQRSKVAILKAALVGQSLRFRWRRTHEVRSAGGACSGEPGTSNVGIGFRYERAFCLELFQRPPDFSSEPAILLSALRTLDVEGA
jgi:hypothetical protein